MRIYRREHADRFSEKERKYCDLVGYAQSLPKEDWEKSSDFFRGIVLDQLATVEEAYPSEVNALPDDWHQGFNSGCLAAFRYVQTALQQDLSTAEREFPNLDTRPRCSGHAPPPCGGW